MQDLLKEGSREGNGIRFAGPGYHDEIEKCAIFRTLMRKRVEQTGISPLIIDGISQEYAVRMKNAVTKEQVTAYLESLTIRYCNLVGQSLKTTYGPIVRKAVQYIESNLASDLEVSFVAEEIGVSSNHLAKCFRKEVKQTIKQYIASRRCEIACELLRNTSMEISEIAAYVGYIDSSYFSRIFKSQKEISPGRSRESYN